MVTKMIEVANEYCMIVIKVWKICVDFLKLGMILCEYR